VLLVTTSHQQFPEATCAIAIFASDSWQPHGKTLWGCGDGQTARRFLYFAAGGELTFNVTSDVNGNVTIRPVKLTNTSIFVDDQRAQTHNMTAGDAWVFTLLSDSNESGYYSFDITGPASASLVINSATIEYDAPIFGHRELPGFSTNCGKAQSMRIIGASVMYTNDSSITNLDGKIAMAQVASGNCWWDVVTSNTSFYSAVAGMKNSWKKDMRKGGYAFLKPSSLEDFKMKKDYKVEGNTVVDSWYNPRDTNASFIAIGLSSENQATQEGYCTHSYSIEYPTDDTWTQTRPPPGNEDVNAKAIALVREVPQFHENETHLADLISEGLQTVNQVVSGVAKAAPEVIGFAKTVASLF